jgi:hypothetical protein
MTSNWCKAAVFAGAYLLSLPAHAATSFNFTDPASIWAIGQGGFQGSYDASGLRLIDTPDGFEVTGSLSITIEGPEIGLLAGYWELRTARLFDAPVGTPASLTAHMNGTLSTTGAVSVYSLSTSTFLSPNPSGFGPCGASINIEDGGGGFVALPAGPFSASFTGNNVAPPTHPCRTLGTSGAFQNRLDGAFGVSFFFTGPGTVSIDFGNSLLSEGTVAPAVPEPSTVSLAGLVVFLSVMIRRRFNT